MRKLSKINEDIFNGIQRRDSNGPLRKEEGKKVHICLDTDIYVSPDCEDYDQLIWEITGFPQSWNIDFKYEYLSSDYKVYIHKLSEAKLSPDELTNAKDFTAPYTYLIYEGNYGTSLVAKFTTYDEICEWYLDGFQNHFTKKDYINICRSIAKKLKEAGDYLEYIPTKDISVISSSSKSYGDINREWQGEYNLKLIDESYIYNWTCENDEKIGNAIKEYVDDMCAKFPELEKYDVDFILWSYNSDRNIGLPLSVNTILNIQKYADYTKKWFE